MSRSSSPLPTVLWRPGCRKIAARGLPLGLLSVFLVLAITATACAPLTLRPRERTPVGLNPSPTAGRPSPTPTVVKPPSPMPSPTVKPDPTFTPRVPTPTVRVVPSPVLSVPTKGEIVRGNAALPRIALTFDAGSGAGGAPDILAALGDRKVKATFFLTGAWVERFPDVARQIVAQGHELGNHSYDHPDFTKLSDQQIEDQIARTERLVQAITGRTTKPFFRPPFGARDSRVIARVEALGYRSVYWTLDSADWREDATASGVLRRVTANAANGSIMIMHVDSKATPAVIGEIIDSLRQQGYTLVPLAELLQS